MRILTPILVMLACGCAGTSTNSAPSGAPNTATEELRPPPPPKAHDYPAELNPLIDLLNKDDFPGGAAFLAQHTDACLASKDCAHAAELLFFNWSIGNENAGDWAAARKVLQDCVASIHDALCSRRLSDLESQHRF